MNYISANSIVVSSYEEEEGECVPVLCAEGQSSHQDVRDEAHGGNIEIRSVHVEARSHRSVLLVAHLPVLQHTHDNTLKSTPAPQLWTEKRVVFHRQSEIYFI